MKHPDNEVRLRQPLHWFLRSPQIVLFKLNRVLPILLVAITRVVCYSQTPLPAYAGSLLNGSGSSMLSGPKSIQVVGHYAFVVSSNSNALEIIDISNPAVPVPKGSLKDGSGGAMLNSPSSLFVLGNYVYVASSGSNAIEIIDITDPGLPFHKSSLLDGVGGALLNTPKAIYVSGNLAYVASYGSNALEIIDISDPAAPAHKNSLSNGTGGALLSLPTALYIEGTNAYVFSSGNNALEIIDISNPLAPAHKGSIAHGTNGAVLINSTSVFVNGNYAYVPSPGANTLEIVDVTNPALPLHAAKIIDGTNGATLKGPSSVYVSGNYAYVTSKNSIALEVIDVTDPSLPTHESSYAGFADSPACVYVSGGTAYVGFGGNSSNIYTNGFQTVDVSNPAAPALVGTLYDNQNGADLKSPNSLCIQGTHCYITNKSDATLGIVDVSNPTNPIYVATFALSIIPNALFVKGNYAFASGIDPSSGEGTLEVIDVSNAMHPIYAGRIDNGSGGAILVAPTSVFVSGNLAFISNAGTSPPGFAGGGASLEIINVSTPSAPSHVGSILDGSGGAVLSNAQSVYVSGSKAYIAAYEALEIIDVSNPSSPVHLGNITNGSGGALLTNVISAVVLDNYAYVLNDYSLQVIDITNPNVPVPTGSLAYPTDPYLNQCSSLYVAAYPSGTYAFVGSSKGPVLDIIDVTNPTAPSNQSNFFNTNMNLSPLQPIVVVSGNYAYSTGTTPVSNGVFEIMSIFTPSPPKAVLSSEVGQTRFTLNWDSFGAPLGYSIDVATDINFSKNVSTTVVPDESTTSLSLSGFNSSTKYFYRIASSNANGLSTYSNIDSVQTLPLTLNQIGLGLSSSPLQAGSTLQALLGFSLASDGPQFMSSLTVKLSINPLSVLSNFKLVRSVDNNFATTGDNTVVTAIVTSSSQQVEFTSLLETLSNTTNYFIVADINGSLIASSPSIQLSLSASDIVLTAGSVSGTPIPGINYFFSGSQLSDIIFNGGTSSSIPYQSFQTNSGLTSTNSVSLGAFQIRDTATDPDALPTTLTSVTVQFTNSSNLRTVALFDGTTNVSEQLAGPTVIFSGLALSAPSHGTRNFSIYSTFKNVVTDDQYIAVSISAATASSSGSGFSMTNAGGATTPPSSNQVAVVASRILYASQPLNIQVQNIPVTPILLVNAVDGLANIDFDYQGPATVSNTSALTMSDAPTAFTSGVLAFASDFQFTSFGTTTLSVASGTLTGAVTTGITVLASPPTISSTISFSAESSTTINANYSGGNGTSHLVVVSANTAPNTTPSQGVSYAPNSAFGTGAVFGNGFVVASDMETSVTVTGLSANTNYFFQVFEYNGSGVTTNYLTTSTPASHSTTSPDGSGNSVSFDIQIPTGGKVTDYTIISIPALSNPTITTTLSENTYKSNWRIMHWDGGPDPVDVNSVSDMLVGQGYWINSNFPQVPTITVKGTNPQQPNSITLKPGWNQIGNPFTFNVSWEDVLSLNSGVAGINNVDSLYVYNVPAVSSHQFKINDGLRAYGGGFVNNKNPSTTVELTIPPSVKHYDGSRALTSSKIGSDLSGSEWFVPITFQVGNTVNSLSGFGMRSDANPGIDKYDAIALPRFFTYVELSSNHPEFFEPYFMRDIVPSTSNYDWTFTASSNNDDRQALLSWDNRAFGTNGAQLILYDVTANVLVDMRQNNAYAFVLSSGHTLKFFYSADGRLSPDITGIGQPYPNPFSTRISIPFVTSQSFESVQVILFDMMGKPVRTLVNTMMDVGYHEAYWDGSDDQGNKVLAGIYIYRFSSSSSPARSGKIIFSQN
jgi:hypothetical protein